MKSQTGSTAVRRAGLVGLAAVFTVFVVGLIHCYDRGGHDFAVFHHAWRLVLSGDGQRIYFDSPDRFLYSPGFAWLLAPLGILPFWLSLSIWNFLKAVSLFGSMLALGRAARPSAPWIVASLGALIIARPLLIDLRYGQVNLFILAAAVFALVPRANGAREGGTLWTSVQWAFLSIMAFAKLLALPLLAIPFLVTGGVNELRLKRERLGVLGGAIVLASLPILTEGFSGLVELYSGWSGALVSKGFPLESHNQSFLAFLHHYFSGEAMPFIARAHRPYRLGWALFSPDTLRWIGAAWTLVTAGLALGWILFGRSRGGVRWVAVSVAFLILPSHLVWKPYFVLTLPVAILVIADALSTSTPARKALAFFAFLMINFTAFDFVGLDWAARIEGAAVFLFMHVLLMGLAIRGAGVNVRRPWHTPGRRQASLHGS